MTTTVDTTTSPLIADRNTLATDLAAATGYPCHQTYTGALSTPCYVLTGAGWSATNGYVIGYRVTVTCLYANKGANLADGVEEMARQAAIVCVDQAIILDDVPEPSIVTIGAPDSQRDYAGVQFTVTIPTQLRE